MNYKDILKELDKIMNIEDTFAWCKETDYERLRQFIKENFKFLKTEVMEAFSFPA